MTGQINTHDFKEIYDKIKKGGVLTLAEVAEGTRWNRNQMSDKLGLYVRTGRIYRVGRNQYSVTPDMKPNASFQNNPSRERRRIEKERIQYVSTCISNMVRCR